MSHVAGESFAYSGLLVDSPSRGDELGGGLGRLLHVRAGQVQLDGDDVVVLVEALAHVREVGSREASHRDPDRDAECCKPRQVLLQEQVDAGVLETDRVEHPRVGLRDARWRVSLASERRDRLRHECVEALGNVGRGQRVEAPGCIEKWNHAASRSTGPSMQSRT